MKLSRREVFRARDFHAALSARGNRYQKQKRPGAFRFEAFKNYDY
jgi:hypothetical protein